MGQDFMFGRAIEGSKTPITAEERALIDSAIAAGRVTRVPQGASCSAGYRYDPKTGQLLAVDASGRLCGDAWLSQRNRAKRQAVEKARKAWTLHENGMPTDQIAARLGISGRTAERYIREARAAVGIMRGVARAAE